MMAGTEIKEAKSELQDALFALITQFEKQYGVCVAYVTLHKAYTAGIELPDTIAVEVRVEV